MSTTQIADGGSAMNPLLFVARLLWDRGLARARAVLVDDREVGAITLEWMVIVGILVAAAIAAGAFFVTKITEYEGKIK
jgi:hypothetical protein